jgi:hypothetical protein
MTDLDPAEIMYAEIKTPMNFNKAAEFGARRNNHLYGKSILFIMSFYFMLSSVL